MRSAGPVGAAPRRGAALGRRSDPPIERVEAAAYTIPTDAPESDGTLAWDSTTLVIAHARAGGVNGLGYSYTHRSAADLIGTLLAPVVERRSAYAVSEAWYAMVQTVRNLGGAGIAATAIAAVDVALWDLKARLMELPLASLLGAVRPAVPIYGSGGFTSYDVRRLQQQLAGWVDTGITRVKMKVGREPAHDLERVRAARAAVGETTELFVDANGAYRRKQALRFAQAYADEGVSWFEEPLVSEDLEGLRLLRDRAPAGMDIAAGEYGYELIYFRRILEAGAVDVLQADATRCLGITGFLQASVLCEAMQAPLSAHTAPALHLHVGCACRPLLHVEYFHDHARIESMLFDGAARPRDGELHPDLSRPGLGLELRASDAEAYRVA